MPSATNSKLKIKNLWKRERIRTVNLWRTMKVQLLISLESKTKRYTSLVWKKERSPKHRALPIAGGPTHAIGSSESCIKRFGTCTLKSLIWSISYESIECLHFLASRCWIGDSVNSLHWWVQTWQPMTKESLILAQSLLLSRRRTKITLQRTLLTAKTRLTNDSTNCMRLAKARLFRFRSSKINHSKADRTWAI